MTSWIRAWFFIVFLAFMILNFFIVIISWLVMKSKKKKKGGTNRTMVAWMTYLRSSSTAFRTSADSALTSALIGKLRLTRIFLDLKSTKKKKREIIQMFQQKKKTQISTY